MATEETTDERKEFGSGVLGKDENVSGGSVVVGFGKETENGTRSGWTWKRGQWGVAGLGREDIREFDSGVLRGRQIERAAEGILHFWNSKNETSVLAVVLREKDRFRE
ncbi:unnamed protein product [Dovyalis caffra]|uniref:Uncharacterized protein n=1 Tax=Dovyalis caffra TaxID=77055 RepID=A0AAV1SDZ7_9ROSI|nr:unnamed protein product [Dovyalis caffra]